MKAVNASMKILKATLESKNAAEASAAAKKVEESITTTKKYWVAKNTKDAMDWSDAAIAGARLAQDGAAAGQWDKVGDGVSKMGGTCKSCHDVHRERLSDGTYKIK
jgi:cytochrome c556